VQSVHSLLVDHFGIAELYWQRVAASGFLMSMADDFPETYVAFEPRVFEVREGFPRIMSGSVPQGVHSLSFKVDLAALADFAVNTDTSIGCRSKPEQSSLP